MSQDTYPGYLWVLPEEKIPPLNLESYRALIEFMQEHELDLYDVGNDLEGDKFLNEFLDLEPEEAEQLQSIYDAFRAEFKEATGLNIGLAHVTDAEGDLEGSGSYWNIDATIIRPEAEALGITWDDQKLFAIFG